MANLKLLLDTRRVKSDGNFNIIFRITHFRKVFTFNSGISVVEKHWNPQKSEVFKSHPNAKLINLKLNKDYFLFQDAILRLDEQFTIEKLRNLIVGKDLDAESCTFKTFADKLIKQMFDAKMTGNALVYQTGVNRFIQFCGRDDVKFCEINYSMLVQFQHHLTIQGLKINSISNYFRSLRAIYNKAIKEKLVERSQFPFFDIKIKTEETSKRAISKADIFKLKHSVVIVNSASWRALNHFLLSFYLIGISFTDLAYLKQENIIDDRIVYRRRKTHKIYNIKIFPQAQSILQNMHSCDCEYLLQILPNEITQDSIQAKKIIKQWIKTTNKFLKQLSGKAGINGSVTTYVARHTFATTAKKLGYSNELIAESLGHEEVGNKTTAIYLDSFDRAVIDEMHQKVIG
jgi:integrase/recombinase XerD